MRPFLFLLSDYFALHTNFINIYNVSRYSERLQPYASSLYDQSVISMNAYEQKSPMMEEKCNGDADDDGHSQLSGSATPFGMNANPWNFYGDESIMPQKSSSLVISPDPSKSRIRRLIRAQLEEKQSLKEEIFTSIYNEVCHAENIKIKLKTIGLYQLPLSLFEELFSKAVDLSLSMTNKDTKHVPYDIVIEYIHHYTVNDDVDYVRHYVESKLILFYFIKNV